MEDIFSVLAANIDEFDHDEMVTLLAMSLPEELYHRKYKRMTENRLDDLSEAECIEYFCFQKYDILKLKDLLHIPETFSHTNGTKWTGLEGLCIMPRRLAISL